MPQPELPSRRFKSGRVITALMLREMSTTYGRSPGGYLWAVLEPIGSIAMMTLILEVGLRIRAPSLGTNFPLFFATGVMPFMMYQRTQAKVAMSLQFSRALLFYPGVTFVDAILARFFLNVLTQLIDCWKHITAMHSLQGSSAAMSWACSFIPKRVTGMACS